MDKRLAKRHKRQVTRARQRVKVSEPDLRTPEQVQAAREASHAINVTGGRDLAAVPHSMPSTRGHAGPTDASATKTDA